jgi:hypothetical protein
MRRTRRCPWWRGAPEAQTGRPATPETAKNSETSCLLGHRDRYVFTSSAYGMSVVGCTLVRRRGEHSASPHRPGRPTAVHRSCPPATSTQRKQPACASALQARPGNWPRASGRASTNPPPPLTCRMTRGVNSDSTSTPPPPKLDTAVPSAALAVTSGGLMTGDVTSGGPRSACSVLCAWGAERVAVVEPPPL